MTVFTSIVLCVACTVYVAFGLNLTLTIDPEVKIIPGLTKALAINCSVEPGFQSTVRTVTTIVLSRADAPEGTYSSIASIGFNAGDQVTILSKTGDNVDFEGHLLSEDKFGHLAMIYTYPTSEAAGVYKCVGGGLDDANVQNEFTQTMTVESEENPNTEDLLRVIKDHDKLLANLEESSMYNLVGIANFKRSFFVFSSVSPAGKQYLLSRPFMRNVDTSEAMCALVGGKLVELMNEEEHKFVRNFLTFEYQEHPVLLGVKYDALASKWKYMGTGNEIVYDDWEQNADPDDNAKCVTLDNSPTWVMRKVACSDNIAYVSFMCQVTKA